MKKALPYVGQLDYGLHLSPQRLRSHKALEVKRLFPREHVIHRPAQLVREYGQRCGCAVFLCQLRKIFFARLLLASAQYRRCGTRPAQMHIANLFPRRA